MDIRYFKVAGHGRFPLDMLRYDRCWPVSANDAAAMDYEPGHTDRRAVRHVVMATISPSAPTMERWGSFLWACGPGYATESEARL